MVAHLVTAFLYNLVFAHLFLYRILTTLTVFLRVVLLEHFSSNNKDSLRCSDIALVVRLCSPWLTTHI